MRIALTHAYSWPEVRRGAERIIHDLSSALAKRGHDVTVLTAGAEKARRTTNGAVVQRLKRRTASEARHEKYFGLEIVPRLAARKFDAVHSLGPEDALGSIRAARVRNHRTVYTNLGLPVRRFWENHPAAKAHRRVVRDVDVYGCMSQCALGLLSTEYGREGTLTSGGVNLAEFRPVENRDRDPTILFSAALSEPRKGGAVLLEAFSILLAHEPRARLWLSGPGDPAATLAHVSPAVRERVDVLPIGDPDAQADRYGRAWVTVLPSKSDSFGLVVVESLACGTPVVASNHSALPELITPGQTGYLCDPDDARSVSDALLAALTLSTKPETRSACREFAARYDWDTSVAPAFERIYAG